ncbi:hypothetical protein KP004_08950 [Geomonas oryzisoli]|uniref:Uncharacterized protein n=1 Tax=Geomonas oryzisoli TaxID=2847992 RepID=A0ABX8JDW2_9BACT|nr:hypothetical protein [Geomonas oryzisoli]QWV95281.1 hypothetical protein KP004_08950 [Geomonas oryzisoli]
MDEMIVFATKNRLGCCEGNFTALGSSHYLERYKLNRESIHKKNAWKTEGMGAAFQGQHTSAAPDLEEINARATVNGLTFAKDDKVVYTLAVESYSGMFIKNPKDDAEAEGHIIHDNTTRFLNLDYHPKTEEIVISVQDSAWERHLAIFEPNMSRYRTVTEGDCYDENPVWAKRGSRSIYYDSAGVGTDAEGRFVGLGEKLINRLDLDSGAIHEVVSVPGYDCFLPKVDGEDTLHFIKRPHEKPGSKGMTFKDFILIPYRLCRAVYSFLQFFSMRYTGEPLSTAGPDPTKAKPKDPKDIFINGNMVNAEKAFKENSDKGDAFPGIAPRSWELMRLEKDGSLTCLKKGVIDFDLGKNGEIVFSNGKYLLRQDKNGKETVIDTIDLVSRVRVRNA